MDTNKAVWPSSYIPAPSIPKWFERGLALFGYNHMAQPNYRVVWGMDARGFLNDNPQEIKYQNPNDTSLGWACFMLERYATPEFFNEQEWAEHRCDYSGMDTGKVVDNLGPFPRQGDYILAAPLMSDDYEPLPLSSALLEELQSRLGAGAQKLSVLGMLEIKRRLKAAKTKAIVDYQLEERKAHFRTHGDKINAIHTREYIGLDELKPSVDQLRTGSLIKAA